MDGELMVCESLTVLAYLVNQLILLLPLVSRVCCLSCESKMDIQVRLHVADVMESGTSKQLAGKGCFDSILSYA